MEVVTTFLEGALRYIGTIAISDWLDIALMALLLYRALRLVGRTRAANLGRVVVYFSLRWCSATCCISTASTSSSARS